MTDPLDPLKPITQKQQDEFDVRRETMSVVQTKCVKCDAWYETLKMNNAYQEAFLCDCGNPIQLTVPAIVVGASAITDLDLDEKFESGMRIKDAIASACHWWNHSGRHMMRKDGGKGHSVAVSLDPSSDNYIPSGIINGEPWDVLDNRERLFVVKSWHHHFISKPQQET